jgi:predicted Zn-dependent protease
MHHGCTGCLPAAGQDPLKIRQTAEKLEDRSGTAVPAAARPHPSPRLRAAETEVDPAHANQPGRRMPGD